MDNTRNKIKLRTTSTNEKPRYNMSNVRLRSVDQEPVHPSFNHVNLNSGRLDKDARLKQNIRYDSIEPYSDTNVVQ